MNKRFSLPVFFSALWLVLVSSGLGGVVDSGSNPTLTVGDDLPLPNLRMEDVSGGEVSLNDIRGAKGRLVIFSSATCPFVVGNGSESEGWQGRYPELHTQAKDAGIGMILVNSNHAKRGLGESMADMQEQYKAQGYRGTYVLDAEHKLADAFGARVTPQVFLFDAEGKLVYTGLIDDSVNSSDAVKMPYLKNALQAIQAGEQINPDITRAIGCSIKRFKK